MTITKREVQPKARITYDEMEAFLTLPVPKEGEEYTLEELLALLEKYRSGNSCGRWNRRSF